MRRTAFAPGRVNLIGDHTDYTGGLVLPMAVQLGTTVSVEPGGDRVRLTSNCDSIPVDLPVGACDPGGVQPAWGRYVAAVLAEVRPATGFRGEVLSTLPVGAGLSSSAALEVALALAFGFEGSPMELALLAQRAERAAVGVPCGLMDQLTSAAGVEGAALLIDCRDRSVRPVPLPGDVEVVAVPSGQPRRLAESAYAERYAQCLAIEQQVGPLRQMGVGAWEAVSDRVLRRRARHVVTENDRVRRFAEAIEAGDTARAGALMTESHRSLRDDYGVSTPALDRLVDDLTGRAGVLGARLTGAGFGGCVVALCRPGAVTEGWRLTPSAAARLFAPGSVAGEG